MIETLITSKTRIRLLTKFFVNSNNIGYLRGLSKELNKSSNAIRRELNSLSKAGYLKTNNVKNKITYQANTDHPLFSTIKKIIHQNLGLDSIVTMIMERMGAVDRVFVIGDYAKGIDSGNIEVVIEGDNLNIKYISQLSQKIEKEIKRKVSFIIKSNFEGEGLELFKCN